MKNQTKQRLFFHDVVKPKTNRSFFQKDRHGKNFNRKIHCSNTLDLHWASFTGKNWRKTLEVEFCFYSIPQQNHNSCFPSSVHVRYNTGILEAAKVFKSYLYWKTQVGRESAYTMAKRIHIWNYLIEKGKWRVWGRGLDWVTQKSCH